MPTSRSTSRRDLGAARKLIARLGAAGWLLSACSLVAQEPAANTATNSTSLRLTVVEADTGKPLPGTSVEIPSVQAYITTFGGTNPAVVTDANGQVDLKVPAGLERIGAFYFSATHPGHEPRSVIWRGEPGRLLPTLPKAYTLKLHRGITIGGYVRDEKGNPIEGASVGVGAEWGGGEDHPPKPGEPQEFQSTPQPAQSPVRTDAHGYWTQAHFGADVTAIYVTVMRPDGAGVRFVSANSRVVPMQDQHLVSVENLKATNAVLVLPDGSTVKGIVVDEQNRPVGGVRILERSAAQFGLTLRTSTNGPDGRFELFHRVDAQIVLTADSLLYALKSVVASASEPRGEVRIILSPAQPARLRVLDEKERPVPGASLSVMDWRSPGSAYSWSGTTDADGRVVWTNAPAETVTLMVTASAYPNRSVRVKPRDVAKARDTETVVRLRPDSDKSLQVRLKAVDAQSGQPVRSFDVLRNTQSGQGNLAWGQSGPEGMFQHTFEAKEHPNAQWGAYQLSIVSESYGVWSSENLFFDEGDVDMVVSLKKANPPAGVVLTPEGPPAANARVLLTGVDSYVYSYQPGVFNQSGQGTLAQVTPDDGSFRFKAAEPQQRLLMTHPSGFAALTVEEMPASGKIQLQAWGRVEGVVSYQGKPLARQQVSLRSPLSPFNVEGRNLNYNTMSDADGRFVFTNLPPGDCLLWRYPSTRTSRNITESHRMTCLVRPGETTRVDYSFNGRTVTGHLDAESTVDWNNNPVLLTLKQGPPPRQPMYNGMAAPQDYRKATRDFARSAAHLDYERKRQQIQLQVDADGNFQAEDVPPGNYTLTVRVTKPSTDRNGRSYGNEPLLGSLEKDVTVPAGQTGTDVDLGNFEVPVKIALSPPGNPIAFRSTTLQGKPFDLASLRGQPVVMVFWAQWAPQSAARLAELRTAAETLATNRRVSFVSVNLDEDDASAQRGIEGLDKGWMHTRLAGLGRAELTEALAVDTLPATFLWSGEGTIAARDVTAKRLAAALDRLARRAEHK